MAESLFAEEPQIQVHQISAERGKSPEYWSIGWRVHNAGVSTIQLLGVRLPHGQFKSAELRFEPAIDLPSGMAGNFTIAVRCHEPQGLVTENAFLIFQSVWLADAWRIFVRIRVIVDAKGVPETRIESITTQRVGFSRVQS